MPLRRRASIPAATAGPIAAGGMSAEACSRPRTAGAKSGVLMAAGGMAAGGMSAGGMAAVPSPATAVLMLPLLRLRWRLVPVLLVP